MELKKEIQKTEGLEPESQALIFLDKEAVDSTELCDLGIQNGSQLRLVIKLVGGI